MTLRYVALDVGCIECGEPSSIIGVFELGRDAFAALEEYRVAQRADRKGEHSFEVHDLVRRERVPGWR